jgi:hypothetical protein
MLRLMPESGEAMEESRNSWWGLPKRLFAAKIRALSFRSAMTDQRFRLQELSHSAMVALITSSTLQPAGTSKEAMDRWVADVSMLSHKFAISMMKTEKAIVERKIVDGLEEKKDEQ